MHKPDPYGFGDKLSLEAFDMTGVDIGRAEDASTLNDLVLAANAMEDISTTITQNRAVSRQDAVAMESIAPGILPTTAPVQAFTLQPTPTNLKVALEAISDWRNMSISNILKAVWRFIMNCLRWVRDKIKAVFSKGGNPQDGKRVVENIRLAVVAVDDIVNQTSPAIDAKDVEQFTQALEKAKLKVSDHFNHLLRDVINTPGTVIGINTLRSNIHTAYGKVDTLSSKFAIALDLCKNEGTYTEAASLLADLAAFKPATLVDLSAMATVVDITKRTVKLPGDEQAKSLRELCDRQRKKRSSWDVKTRDTLQGFLQLTERVVDLLDAVDDPAIGTEIPDVVDFSEKAKNAPQPIAQPLMDASAVITKGFEVLQDTISVFVYVYEELISLVEVMWEAIKTLMGSVATTAKKTNEVKDLVSGIEARLKSSLKKA
jgi:hypothetical protein